MSTEHVRPPSPQRPWWLRALTLLVALAVLVALALAVAGIAGAGGGVWIGAGISLVVAFALLVTVGLVAQCQESNRAGHRAYDLIVGAERAIEHHPEGPAPVRVGWAGREGPAIDPRTWPRSPPSSSSPTPS